MTKNYPWYRKDSYGWPIERITNRGQFWWWTRLICQNIRKGLHRTAHLFHLDRCQLDRAMVNGCEWLMLRCVGCGRMTMYAHSSVCKCNESRSSDNATTTSG